MERVLAGESLTVTRAGTPVAELRPVRRPGLDRETLLERWRRLPAVDPVAFRRAIDAVLDPGDFLGIDDLEVVAVPHPDGLGP